MTLLNTELVKLLLTILNLLEVFKSRCQLSQVFPQSGILECQFIYFFLLLVKMICDAFVSSEEVKLGLYSVILFIQEFYLVL